MKVNVTPSPTIHSQLNNSIDAITNFRSFEIVTHVLNEKDFKSTNVEMVSGSNFIPLPSTSSSLLLLMRDFEYSRGPLYLRPRS